MSDALKRAKARMRAKAKGRKIKPSTHHRDGVTLKRNVLVVDIEFGSWSFIGQPPSPDSNIPEFLT